MNSKNYNALLSNVISGNAEGVSDCIKSSVNIYCRTNDMETLLYIAMLHRQNKVANILLEIYASDLKFIESVYKTDVRSTFWIDTPILIVFGKEKIKEFKALYSKYIKCENDPYINMGRYVMFLLKRDNFKCKQVMMLSPTTKKGQMLLVSMIKCVNSNGLLDLNAETPDASSLLRVTVQSGLLNLFDVLLKFGAEFDNVLEFACYAIEFNRIEFLDELSKRFEFSFYDWINSNMYYWAIFKGDNWDAFKYVIEKIITETSLTWNAILNLVVPYHDADPKVSSLTVFEFIIFGRQFKIAENCWKYVECDSRSNKILDLLYVDAESESLVLKMIESDPSILENTSKGKLFFHDVICAMSAAIVRQIYRKYPAVKKILFKHKDVSQNIIDKLLATGQTDKVGCILENSIEHLDVDMLSSIAYTIIATSCANLFSYRMWVKFFNLSSLDMVRLITSAVQNGNLEIISTEMSHTDNQPNLFVIQFLLYQTREYHVHLIDEYFYELIERNENFDKVSCDGKNMLHHSIEFDNYEATHKLLSLGINIDQRDILGKLPIHYVRSVKIYRLLNAKCITTSYENVPTIFEKDTILHLCVSSGDDRLDLIKYILDNGGNINAANNEERTPIFYVRDFITAQLLSKYKPNLNVVDINGFSPLINFIGNLDHSHAIINLFYAPEILRKNRELHKFLWSRRCDSTFFIEMIGRCNICTKLMLHLKCVDLLAKTSLGNTPMHVAAGLQKYDIIDKLIKRGLSLNTPNMAEETPFLFYMRANANEGADDGYKRLLKYNPKVNHYSIDGTTPLTFAVQQLNTYTYDLICELLLRGANLLDVFENDRDVYLFEMAYEVQQIFRFICNLNNI